LLNLHPQKKENNLSTKAGSFSLGSDADFLALGNSRRQLLILMPIRLDWDRRPENATKDLVVLLQVGARRG